MKRRGGNDKKPPSVGSQHSQSSQSSSGGVCGSGSNQGSQGENVDFSQYSQLNEGRDASRIVQFVLPRGTTPNTCSPTLLECFNLCSGFNLTCEWVDEQHIPDIIPMPGNFFICDPFEGPGFNHLEEELKKSKNFVIVGPQCMRFCFHRRNAESGIIHRGFPMYTLGMRGLVISLSGFRNRAVKMDLSSLIRKMGGFPTPEFTLGTTHVVTDTVLSPKCSVAYSKNMPVMTAQWVRSTWEQSLEDTVHATDPEFAKFECPIFHCLSFCVSQVTAKDKQQLKTIILSNGGTYSAELLKDKTNILIIPKGEGEKYKYSMQWGLPCLKPSWVIDSKAAGHVIGLEEYRVDVAKPPLSSTPTDSKLYAGIGLPDLTSCSAIANATTRNTFVGSQFPNRNFSILSEATAEDFEAIKNASIVGPFLDGCKVYLCNPDKSEHAEQVRKLLNGSGATRLNQITDAVSHVVVMGGKISDKELAILKKLDPRPHVVGFQWLSESAKLGRPAEEEYYQFPYEDEIEVLHDSRNHLVSTRISARQPSTVRTITEGNQIGSAASIQTLVESITTRSRSSGNKNSTSVNNNGRSMSDSDKSAGGSSTSLRSKRPSDNLPLVVDLECEEIQTKEKMSSKEKDNSQSQSQTIGGQEEVEELETRHSSGSGSPSESQPQSESATATSSSVTGDHSELFIFVGVTFKIKCFESEQDITEIEKLILDGGGSVISIGEDEDDSDTQTEADIVILPIVSAFKSINPTMKEFTRYWLDDCVEQANGDIPLEFYHIPLQFSKKIRNIFKGVVIAISSYTNNEKVYIARVVVAMGGVYQDSFARKTDPETRVVQSTHLVCGQTENEKVRAAIKWSVPVVTKDWIVESFKAQKKLDEDDFDIYGKNDATKTNVLGGTPQQQRVSNRSNRSVSCRGAAGRSQSSNGSGPSTSSAATGANKPSTTRATTTAAAVAVKTPERNSMNPPISGVVPFIRKLSIGGSGPDSPGSESMSGGNCGHYGTPTQSQTPRSQSPQTPNPADTTTSDSPLFAGLDRKASRQIKGALKQFEIRDNAIGLNDTMEEMKIKVKVKVTRKNSTPEHELIGSLLRQASRRYCSPKSNSADVVKVPADPAAASATKVTEPLQPLNGLTSPTSSPSKRTIKTRTRSGSVAPAGGTAMVSPKSKSPNENIAVGSRKRASETNSDDESNDDGDNGKERTHIVRKKSRKTASLMAQMEAEFAMETQSQTVSQEKKNQENQDDDEDEIEEVEMLDLEEVLNAQPLRSTRSSSRVTSKSSAAVSTVPVVRTRSKPSEILEQETKRVRETRSTAPLEKQKSKPDNTKTEPVVPKPVRASKLEPSKEATANGVVLVVPKVEPPIPVAQSAVEPKPGPSKATPSRSNNTMPPPEVPLKSPERKQWERSKGVGWRGSGRSRKLTFMFTGIGEEDKQRYTKTITDLGGQVNPSSKFSESIDGIFAGSLARSEKVLCAIASGKKILRLNYLVNSKNKGVFLANPDAFVWGCGDGKTPHEELLATSSGYWFRRISSAATDKPFSKFRAIILEKSDSKCEAYKNLINAGGGKIYEIKDLQSANVIICDSNEIVKHFLGETPLPKIPVKAAICLHEIITKCNVVTDEFFEV